MESPAFNFLPFGTIDSRREFAAITPMLARVERRAGQIGLADRLMVQRVQNLSYMDVIYRDKELIGVVVATPTVTALWVDAIFIQPHQCDDAIMQAVDGHLQGRARSQNLPCIRGSQQFRGGRSFMERAGWKPIATQYERKVSP